MQVESTRSGIFRITLHAYELSALVAAARWAAGGGEGEVSEEAREQLRRVLESYDGEVERLTSTR
jgi:hypothetical protein